MTRPQFDLDAELLQPVNPSQRSLKIYDQRNPFYYMLRAGYLETDKRFYREHRTFLQKDFVRGYNISVGAYLKFKEKMLRAMTPEDCESDDFFDIFLQYAFYLLRPIEEENEPFCTPFTWRYDMLRSFLEWARTMIPDYVKCIKPNGRLMEDFEPQVYPAWKPPKKHVATEEYLRAQRLNTNPPFQYQHSIINVWLMSLSPDSTEYQCVGGMHVRLPELHKDYHPITHPMTPDDLDTSDLRVSKLQEAFRQRYVSPIPTSGWNRWVTRTWYY